MTKKILLLALILGLTACQSEKKPQYSTSGPATMMKSSPFYEVYHTKEGVVQRGQGLYQALKNVDIDNAKALEIINALRDEVEFSKLKVGDELVATFNQHNVLVKFSFKQNPAEKHVVKLSHLNNKWEYFFHEEKTEWATTIIEGRLRAGSTLQDDLFQEGLEASVVNEIAGVLACKVNFRRNARMGDRYKVLLNERRFKGKVIETKVLYTSYEGRRAGFHESFYYNDPEKSSTYSAHYTEDGQALIRSGLRYPLSRLHVRSGYGWRRHPVTGRRAMHRGVDLRGRVGKPVHAAAAGKVVQSTYNKYAGNKIAIRHRDGSTSYYLHLNRRRVKRGQWVRSYQVIGTVGSTGRVTGPHLHFGFKRANGRWMNPLNKRMIATPKLKGSRLARLKEQVDKIKNIMIDTEVSSVARYIASSTKEEVIEFKLNL